MTPTEPGFNAAKLRLYALYCKDYGIDMPIDPASILVLLDEVERLTELLTMADSAHKARRVERDTLRDRWAAVKALIAEVDAENPTATAVWLEPLRAIIAEGGDRP